MSLVKETEELRKTLAGWAADPEWSLLCRYDILRTKPPPSVVDLWFRRARNMLARFGLLSPYVTKYSWLPALKHAHPNEHPTVLLIWAVGIEQDDLHRICDGFLEQINPESSRVPVFVTDCADFAYFSRLHWLVEYVPDLSGEGPSYRKRKLQYLAWRYRDALVVPASAGTASEDEWNKVMEMIR